MLLINIDRSHSGNSIKIDINLLTYEGGMWDMLVEYVPVS